MGHLLKPMALKPFMGILYHPDVQLDTILDEIHPAFGKIDYTSDVFNFDHSDYYQDEMGQNLKKVFISFKGLAHPKELYEPKLTAAKIEAKFKDKNGNRQVNLDPGYVTLHNVLLLTTKNYSHRIPLGHNIYCEVTLLYKDKDFQTLPWTYPDFKSECYRKSLTHIRQELANQL